MVPQFRCEPDRTACGSVITVMMLLMDLDAPHVNLYIRLRNTAGQVGTPTLTNIWLALELLGALSSLIQSLATLSFAFFSAETLGGVQLLLRNHRSSSNH